MSPTDPKHAIPSFNGKNFSSWQTSMIGIFSFYQVLDIVVGVKPYSDDFETGTDGKIKLDSSGKGKYLPTDEQLDPDAPIRTQRPKIDVSGSDAATKLASKTASMVLQAKYDEKNMKALGYISMALDTSYHFLLEGETRAFVIWDRIQEKYGKVGLVSGFSSFQSLFNYRCDNKPIRAQIARMEDLRHKVSQSGIAVNDMWFSLIILNSLPQSYQILATTLLSMREKMDELNPSDIIAKIEEEETHRKSAKASSDAHINRISQTKTLPLRCTREGCPRPEGSHNTENHWENGKRPSGSGSGNNKGGGNKGKGKPGGNNRKKGSGSKADLKTIRFDDKELDSAMAANTISTTLYSTSETTSYNTKWMCDTGCTRHVTNNMQDFTEYQPFSKPGKARIGDGSEIPIIGYGKVKLNHINSRREHVEIILDEVLYVPKASGRFFAPRVAVQKGREISIKENYLKLFKTLRDGRRGLEVIYAQDNL